MMSLGIPGDLEQSDSTGLISPLHHRRRHVGTFYLAGKEDGDEFTGEDEETMGMFASQAALVIANARTHREERRARNDLETLTAASSGAAVQGRVAHASARVRSAWPAWRQTGGPLVVRVQDECHLVANVPSQTRSGPPVGVAVSSNERRGFT